MKRAGKASDDGECRKAIYLELHPETAQHVAGGHAKHGSASEKSAFAESTSQSTGKSRRSVEIAAARGAALGDDRAFSCAGGGGQARYGKRYAAPRFCS
jgi:hypothetical protein